MIAREQRNLRAGTEGARPTDARRWQDTQAANDSNSAIEFRTLTANRATRHITKDQPQG